MPVKCGTTAIESIKNGAVIKAYAGSSLVFQKASGAEYFFETPGTHNIAAFPSSWSNIYIDIRGAGGGAGFYNGQGNGNGGSGGELTYISLGAKQIRLLAGENGGQGEEGGGGPGGGGAGGRDGEYCGGDGGRGGGIQIDPALQAYLTVDKGGGAAGGAGDHGDSVPSGSGGNGGRVYGVIPKSALSGINAASIVIGAGAYHWYAEGAGGDGSVYIKIY